LKDGFITFLWFKCNKCLELGYSFLGTLSIMFGYY
jgi:hypothetical protein